MNKAERLILRDALLDEEFNSYLEGIRDDIKPKLYTHEQRNYYLILTVSSNVFIIF